MKTMKTTKPTASETEEQIAVIEYCDVYGIPIYHIANEGKRTYYTGNLLRKAGMRKGVPDLCIPLPRGKYHGFYIEMKSEAGKVTKEQTRWLKLLKNNGYATAICYGADEAINKISAYMRLEERKNENE